MATSELRLLLHDTISEVQRRWRGTVGTTLYVDDLTLATSGLPLVAARLLQAALDFVIHKLEKELLLEVSAKKSCIVSKRYKLALVVAARLRQQKVRPCRHAKLLGSGTVAGRARTTKVLKNRLKAFWQDRPQVPCFAEVGSTLN